MYFQYNTVCTRFRNSVVILIRVYVKWICYWTLKVANTFDSLEPFIQNNIIAPKREHSLVNVKINTTHGVDVSQHISIWTNMHLWLAMSLLYISDSNREIEMLKLVCSFYLCRIDDQQKCTRHRWTYCSCSNHTYDILFW